MTSTMGSTTAGRGVWAVVAATIAVAWPAAASWGAQPATATTTAGSETPTEQIVRIELGPELARRMGVRVLLRPVDQTQDSRGRVVAIDLPRATTSDASPPPASVRLAPGRWQVETSAAGYLPSTRQFDVTATEETTLKWSLVPNSSDSDITFAIQAPTAPGVALELVHATTGQRWTCTSHKVDCTLRLAPGSWTVKLQAAGHYPAEHGFTLSPGAPAQTFTWALQPSSAAASGHRKPKRVGPAGPAAADWPERKPVVLGLTLVTPPLVALGLGLTVSGRVRYVDAVFSPECGGPLTAACGNALLGPTHRSAAGVGLLGAGVGTLVAGVTAVFPVRPRVWISELAVGGALTVVGIGWAANNTMRLQQALDTGTLATVVQHADRRLGAAALLGFGTGLTVGALTGFLVQRHHGRRSHRNRAPVTAYASPGQVGLVWSGAF